MQVTETAPIFRIFDEAIARRFYVEWLGFTVLFEHRFEPGMPLYMAVTRAGLVLHLSEHHGDATPGARVFVRVDGGLDAYLEELRSRPYPNLRPGITEAPWGRELSLHDPFGNRITLCESSSSSSSSSS